jgi:4-hydroxy-tetrahydrodipicolinate reductase
MKTLKVVQIGMGPLGRKITKFISERKNIEVIGAVDIDERVAGQDLGEHCGLNRMDITIQDSVDATLKILNPDAVILTTVSSLEKITPQIEEIVSFGIPVVSTCEELSFPWETSSDLSKSINEAAIKNGVAVLGTGVNPGFLMDAFPVFLTAVCQTVESVKISRVQNAAERRIPFQKKIGAGLTLKKFEIQKNAGTLRHVGLTESVRLIANNLGWKLTKTEDVISPVVAQKEIITEAMTISAGCATGVQQIGRGYVGGEEKITLLFRASVGEPEPRDTIEIKGNPNITSTIDGGLNGDVATCAITINAINQIIRAQPGLRTMVDIPVVSFFS